MTVAPKGDGWLAVAAPAKVNLVLRVLGRRADGYHDLETLMVPISLADTVWIRARQSDHVTVDCRVEGDATVEGGPQNLASRAAVALLEAAGRRACVEIHLHKRVPHGAGLGGGSSDAGAVLRGLASILGLPRCRDRDIAVARRLGADVPFFLACRPAWATGIGDLLEPLAGFPVLNLVVAKPAVSVATAWAYREALSGLTSPESENNFRRFSFADAALGRGFRNDFEPGVARAFPDIARVGKTLQSQGASATVLSGSGAAMVGLFATLPAARRAAAVFRDPDRAWAVRTLRGRPRTPW
jgi:4-diphosphocytidyl-2-C-methyl-D-erythritol kinase